MRDCKAVRRTRIDLEHGVLDDVDRRWTTSKAGRAPAQVGLPHSVSTISALIVSHDKLADTHASFVRRSAGTLIAIVSGLSPISDRSLSRNRHGRVDHAVHGDFAQSW